MRKLCSKRLRGGRGCPGGVVVYGERARGRLTFEFLLLKMLKTGRICRRRASIRVSPDVEGRS